MPAAPARPRDAHKGTFGTVVVVGGSATMIGAPALAAGAALRIGAGLAKLAVPQHILPFCLIIEPGATGIAIDPAAGERAMGAIDANTDDKTVLAVGPGMGVGREQQELIEAILRRPARVVLDADGLNNLAQLADAPSVPRCPLVLTPHPGEFHRLAEPARVRSSPTDPDQRPAAARELAVAYNAIVVLKGHQTVIADGRRTAINATGNPALATAGSGDVLTGAIAGLMAQGMEPFDAAVLGAHLHGLAADCWADHHGHAGLTADRLADHLPVALHQYRGVHRNPA